MIQYTYPHAPIDVLDESSALRESRIQRCLHRPLVFIQSSKGPVNIPVWASGAEAISTYGLETFNMFGKFYHNEQFFLESAIFQNHGAYLVRLADKDATSASQVVEIHVTESNVTQYQRDANGAIIKDDNGKPLPQLDDSNQVIKEPGYTFKFVKRELAEDEKRGKIKPSTIQIGDKTTKIYPIWDAKDLYTGELGNTYGVRMYFDWSQQDESLVDGKKALTFNFQAIQFLDGSGIATPVRDVYGALGVGFMAKPNQVDERVQMRLSFDDKMRANYYDPVSKEQLLPFDINLYPETFKAVGDMVKDVEVNDPNIEDGWMVDILSAINKDGNPYAHVEIDRTGDSVILSSGYDILMSGGSDGDTSREAFEERIRAYLTGDVYPEIIDNLRYPFTHIYDTGFSYDTKVAITLFMSKRDDFRPSLSTQDVAMEPNLREEDMSMGAALRAKALLTPESMVYGTPCCRAEIFGHAGYSTNPQYKNILPLTIWAATRRAETMSSMSMRRTLGRRPTAEVNMLRDLNYTEYEANVKQMKFDNGINYIQYADEETLFLPDIRTVYPNTTSVLAGSSYVDAVIALKYIVRWTWTHWSGAEDAVPEDMYQRIATKITTDAYNAFGSIYRCQVFVDQTEEMRRIGDEIRVTADLWGSGIVRKMTTRIIAKRTNFSTPTVL